VLRIKNISRRRLRTRLHAKKCSKSAQRETSGGNKYHRTFLPSRSRRTESWNIPATDQPPVARLRPCSPVRVTSPPAACRVWPLPKASSIAAKGRQLRTFPGPLSQRVRRLRTIEGMPRLLVSPEASPVQARVFRLPIVKLVPLKSLFARPELPKPATPHSGVCTIEPTPLAS
jgi:hypothetical protein